jgi:hypothetical protein
LAAIERVWATKVVCLLTNLISKFRKDDIKLTISWTIERNSELPLRFMWMTSTNTFESLLNWTQSNPLCLASFIAKSNAHASPSTVEITVCRHYVISGMNWPLLSRKHNPTEVFSEPVTKEHQRWILPNLDLVFCTVTGLVL